MKFTPSAVGFGSPSGSQGSTTASHNRSGYYLRNRVVPTNPNTSRQQEVRSLFGSMVQSWTMLSAALRGEWDAYAAGVPIQDSMGNSINLTGQNWYIGNNTARVQAGLAGVSSAPTILNTGEPVTSIVTTVLGTADSIGVAAGSLSTTLNLSTVTSDDGDVLIYLGAPQNASRTFFKGPYQLAAVVPIAAAAGSVAWTTAVDELLQAIPLAETQFRPLRIRVAYDDGRLSQPFSIMAPVIDDAV